MQFICLIKIHIRTLPPFGLWRAGRRDEGGGGCRRVDIIGGQLKVSVVYVFRDVLV